MQITSARRGGALAKRAKTPPLSPPPGAPEAKGKRDGCMQKTSIGLPPRKEKWFHPITNLICATNGRAAPDGAALGGTPPGAGKVCFPLI